MNRLGTVIALACAATAAGAAAAPAAAADGEPLSAVAARLGFAYHYLGPEDAVSLARPGVVVVLRPGERLFEVNDRTEATAGEAPRFVSSDLYVDATLVARLRAIAARYAVGSSADHAIAVLPSPPDPPPATGPLSPLALVQIPGRQRIGASGTAPANAPVVLTLVGSFQSEIPDVVLNRRYVTADASGAYGAEIPIAPGYLRGAILTVVATSPRSPAPSSATIVMRAPNADAAIPADQVPRAIR